MQYLDNPLLLVTDEEMLLAILKGLNPRFNKQTKKVFFGPIYNMGCPFLLVTDEEMLLAILKGATMDNIQITAFQNRRHCTALTCTANVLVIN